MKNVLKLFLLFDLTGRERSAIDPLRFANLQLKNVLKNPETS